MDANASVQPECTPDRADMNRLVMNYLVTEGFKEAAEKFMVEAELPLPPEVGEMEGRIKIRDAIQSGRVSEAIEMVQQLHPELLDDDKRLFFLLQQQQLIELIRERRVEDALTFAAEKLSERGEEDHGVLDELERTMALLAFEDPSKSPFSDLLALSHRQKVASELNAALLRAEHAECTQPKLSGLIKLLLWSQEQLERKNIRYNKAFDSLVAGTVTKSNSGGNWRQ